MAGGTFIAQNKVRPGAYINFKAVSAPAISVGARGVAAMPLATGWGEDYIELLSTELQNGKSIAKVGCSFVDDDALLYRLILSNTYKLLIARTDINAGKKASVTIGDLKAEAVSAGEAGNDLSVSVAADGETGYYNVVTKLGDTTKDTQRVNAIASLTANTWVSFSDVASEGTGEFTPSDGSALSGGENASAKASATVGDLKVEARYAGIVGNRLSVIVTIVGETSLYDVTTALDGIGKDTQRVDAISKLAANDWVTFSDIHVGGAGSFTVTAGTALKNGANGTETKETIASAVALLETKQFNVLGCMSEDSAVKSLVITTIKQLRENEGRKCKAVLYNAAGLSGADYEGIISSKQGYKTQDGDISAQQFVAQLTGMAAGANLGVALTHKTIPGAVEVIGEPLTHDDIVEALKTGWLVLSRMNDGTIVVEQDINTLCNDMTDKDDSFRKNLIINTLDEIGNTIVNTWDKTYCGKVHNNETQRQNYKAALIKYFKELESMELIQNFDKDADIIIEQGENLDSVVVNWWAQLIDVMEKLYMTTYVRR